MPNVSAVILQCHLKFIYWEPNPQCHSSGGVPLRGNLVMRLVPSKVDWFHYHRTGSPVKECLSAFSQSVACSLAM